MPEGRAWTDEADNLIRNMRADGATWPAIGATLSFSRNTVIERGPRIRAAAGPVQIARPPAPKTIRAADHCRPATGTLQDSSQRKQFSKVAPTCRSPTSASRPSHEAKPS